jgi:aprataxin
VASELRRKYGQFSKSEQARIQARDADDPPDVLPEGRDWMKEIITGIHAVPSMNHLHVHVMSRDMVSDRLTRSAHYNSFQTSFLVPLEKFPLAKDDPIRQLGHGPWHAVDLVCWRCKKNFGNKVTKLKAHLEEELDQWKRE